MLTKELMARAQDGACIIRVQHPGSNFDDDGNLHAPKNWDGYFKKFSKSWDIGDDDVNTMAYNLAKAHDIRFIKDRNLTTDEFVKHFPFYVIYAEIILEELEFIAMENSNAI